MPTRQQIVEKAREYVGTPFRHQGRVKGRGCDCVGLPLMVAEELALLDKNGVPLKGADHASYAAQPMGNAVHQECAKRLVRKSVADMQPGDVVSVRCPLPSHVGIIGENQHGLTLIHAYNGGNECVVEMLLDDKWRERIVGCFGFPGVE